YGMDGLYYDQYNLDRRNGNGVSTFIDRPNDMGPGDFYANVRPVNLRTGESSFSLDWGFNYNMWGGLCLAL
ncbi:MAG: hypothetical protein FWG50_11005, partial [Kiritimatiellaeota bacterium]|nr:hypothetical protein [Kiritimatiellota bacterium]